MVCNVSDGTSSPLSWARPPDTHATSFSIGGMTTGAAARNRRVRVNGATSERTADVTEGMPHFGAHSHENAATTPKSGTNGA